MQPGAVKFLHLFAHQGVRPVLLGTSRIFSREHGNPSFASSGAGQFNLITNLPPNKAGWSLSTSRIALSWLGILKITHQSTADYHNLDEITMRLIIIREIFYMLRLWKLDEFGRWNTKVHNNGLDERCAAEQCQPPHIFQLKFFSHVNRNILGRSPHSN